MLNKAKGFTLIELILVIIVLGILAVTAAPKFLNLQDDAKVATLKSLAGAINSAGSIVYGKAAIKGVENIGMSNNLDINGIAGGINIVWGYPETIDDLIKVVDGLSDGNFDILPTGTVEPTTPSRVPGYLGSLNIAAQGQIGYTGFDCAISYYKAYNFLTNGDIHNPVYEFSPALPLLVGSVTGCED